MRIAMLISTPFPPEEGIGYYTYNLSKKLIEKGHKVTVITRGHYGKVKHFYFDRIEVYKPQFFPVYPFHVHVHKLFVEKFFRNLDNEFDVIHIHSPLSPPITSNSPIVGTIHTSLVEDIKHYQVLDTKGIGIKLTTYISGYPLTQELISNAETITTVSSAVAKELINYYSINNPIIVGNGVNEKVFHPVKKKSDDYVLYVGRLDYRKGIFDLIKAVSLLKELDMKVYIVGKGPLKPTIERYLAKNNLKQVLLLGHVSFDKLVRLYQNASVFVFPSHYEGLPTVVLEAMSSGLPVVVSDIPAHKDVVENWKNGLLTEKGSPQDLAEKIALLCEDEKLKRKLGRNARKTIEKRFTWDKITRKFEKIYEMTTS
ncbi:glycosyltransferase family 4 protein [Thermococcus sibiricus]|uniref:Phosphatidylinositol glycantransferase-class A n=1 Tax=Thermococcus sibiricus TaxID=172049 RepID=A0A101ELC8_9EURY|nr:glycosyltransferase family 4 protein [Thermococcus sibiricus]KUK17269.1 MAG: Phosphatidylinositol glycantransferase-class A [Thermococcus sibiricus]